MKFFTRLKKINKTHFVLGLMALVLFVVPFVMTLYVLSAGDRLEKKRNAYETEKLSINEADYYNNRSVSDSMPHTVTTEAFIEDEPENVETSVSHVDALLMSKPDKKASEGDATKIVATTGDASKSETSKTAKKKVASSGDAVSLNGKKVYLTFDDGPSKYTNELLDVLEKYNVKATFFVVVNSYKYSEELKRIVRDGHTLGLHSQSHIYSKLYADLDSYKKDVSGVHDWVERITGVDTRYYRFPGGSSNDVSDVSMSECIKYLKDNGYKYFDWNAESKDAEDLSLTPEELTENVLYYVENNEGNSIVLMHDLDKHYNTIKALPMIIEALKDEGYELCAVDDNTSPFHHRDE